MFDYNQCPKCGAQWPEREGLECRACTKDAPVAAPREAPQKGPLFHYEMTGADWVDALSAMMEHLRTRLSLGGFSMKNCGFTLSLTWSEVDADGMAVKKKKGCPGCMYCRKKVPSE